MLRQLHLFTILLTVATFARAADDVIPHAQDRPPGPALSPAEALQKMQVPPGFSVELVASEPDLVNPVAMTFDDRGRIWVTESFEYPRLQPGPGKDRVKVLEDTDHDGKIDKVTIFAEGLNIPSGIAVGYGGVWVANSPDILFLQDTDGDGKADKQEVVVTGFGRTDTHELPNSLTWGPDGWLYGLNGVFNYSKVKYRGKEYAFTCALFRIHPRTRDFEIFCEGTSNPWGLGIDPEGSFFVSACVIDHLWHLTQSGYYHRQGGPYPPFTWKIESIVKHKHQKAAYCGLTYFDSDAYPEAFRDKLYMGNIHAGGINVDKLQRSGSSYVATTEPDFLTANDAWFMPVAQKTGPDGCLYVLDWYDRYHCYQDARRDPEGIERAKGRLYRVRYKETPRAPAFDLAKETDDQLIARLGSPNVYFRDAAQRVLAQRNSAAARPKLQTLVLDSALSKKTRMHALWALAPNEIDAPFYTALLGHKDSSLRAWGVRIAGNARSVPQNVQPALSKLATDKSPDVQLQRVIAAVRIAETDPFVVFAQALDLCPDDELIPHIVWQNLHPLLEESPEKFLDAVERARIHEVPGLAALWPRMLDRLLARKKFDAPLIARLIARVRDAAPSVARQCVANLALRIQTGELKGDSLEDLKGALFTTLDPIVKAGPTHPLGTEAGLLAATWGDARALPHVRLTFKAPVPSELRLRALAAMIASKDKGVLDDVVAVLASELSDDFRGQVLAALGRLEDPRVADAVLPAWKTLKADTQAKVVELLTGRVVWAKRLLSGIGKKEIPPEALNVTQVRKLLALKDAELTKLVTAQWGTLRNDRSPARDEVIVQMRALIQKSPGNPHKGRLVFDKLCGQCHKIYGQGQEVGPDVTVNGRSSFEQLLSNVFDPNQVIGVAYQGRTVLTTGGRVVSGLLVEENEQRVVLKVQGGKQEIIPRSEVDEFKVSELSLMPEDVEKVLKPEEIVDLFAFLTLDLPPDNPKARQLPLRDVQPRSSTNPADFKALIGEIAPGFNARAVGEGGIALLASYRGRGPVLRTHPVNPKEPCVLVREILLPAGKKSTLKLSVGRHAIDEQSLGDWRLVVKANGDVVFDGVVGAKLAPQGWADVSVDLSKFAGQPVKLEVWNQANDWNYEFGYWSRADVVSE